MDRRTVFVTGLAAIGLTACTGSWKIDYEEPLDASETSKWQVSSVAIQVPDELTVSEANSLAPNADIVWHGEEPGDRKSQVGAILKEGIAKGAAGLNGQRQVRLVARLLHFHAVTPSAVSRAPSAVHNITFDIRVYDAASGLPLIEPQRIQADLEAHVGTSAITAALAGNTQRVRIVRHLAAVTRGWLDDGPDQRREFSGLGR